MHHTRAVTGLKGLFTVRERHARKTSCPSLNDGCTRGSWSHMKTTMRQARELQMPPRRLEGKVNHAWSTTEWSHLKSYPRQATNEYHTSHPPRSSRCRPPFPPRPPHCAALTHLFDLDEIFLVVDPRHGHAAALSQVSEVFRRSQLQVCGDFARAQLSYRIKSHNHQIKNG